MQEFKDWIFISEINLQCKIALKAFDRLEIASDNSDHLEIWGALQSILIATANVSKILWSAKHAVPSESLRVELKIGANNILANREFRNHFEHYDERIEDWFQKSSGHVFTDLQMNPSLMNPLLKQYDYGIANRGYNSFNNTLVFRNKTLDLNELKSALLEVRKRCLGFVLDYP